MNSVRKLALFPILISSLLLSGCFSKAGQYDITTLDKQSINYTYKDYFNHNVYNIDNSPSKGTVKLLIIPVWFTDSGTYLNSTEKAKVRSDIELAYFGTNNETGWRSVKTFYEEESHGSLTLTGTVSDWYEISYTSTMFYSEKSGAEKTCTLVESAVNWYKTSADNSLQSFDSDKNGYLDGVMLIYASPDYRVMKNDSASNMWAYCYWLQKEGGTASNPIPNQFFWASYDFMYGNGGPGEYHSGDTSHCTLDTHTYIHEMGHIFGLEDYYDYSNQFKPAGGFSMQDYNVGSHDPYSSMALGWSHPYVPTKDCTIKIKDFQNSGDVVLLSNNFANSPFDEYMLLELYSPTGLNEFDSKYKYDNKNPQGPKYWGIRLWHVDGRLLYLRESDTNYSTSRISNVIENDKYYSHLCSNTYYGSEEDKDYISPLGKNYADYNVLQLIRNRIGENYESTYPLSEEDLFYAGDSFSMSTYRRQFVNSGMLNSKTSLGWSFKVNKIANGEATLTFYKGL